MATKEIPVWEKAALTIEETSAYMGIGTEQIRALAHAARHGMGDFPAFWVGFQSTRPMRGATAICSRRLLCDGRFNPRAPCGARHVLRDAIVEVGKFQSTRPMRGATASLL